MPQPPALSPVFPRLVRRFFLAAAVVMATDVPAEEKAAAEFGANVQLAPFVVNGKKLSIAVHARTKSDRSYAGEFAEEVVEIAYETLGDSTGKGLVIVGREKEPHPVVVVRKFLAMAAAGQLDPAVAEKAAELNSRMADWKAAFRLDEPPENKKPVPDADAQEFKLTFDMLVPALPLPLEGLPSKLYQLSWAEGFDDARIERKLRTLTVTDLESNTLSQYDWVFYLPPRNAFSPVMDDIMKQGMKAEKVGLFKRAAIRSAMFAFRPAIKKAVEAMRKGVLYMTVLRAESSYSKDDIGQLCMVYTQVLMPDFKFNGGSEHRRALEAIEKQKAANAEYAKDPFVKPERIAAFNPAAYTPFEGEYNADGGRSHCTFKRLDDSAYNWQYMDDKPRPFYPAGERLLVNDDGTMTIEFKTDDHGAVTGVEERWVRRRQTLPRKVAMEPAQTVSPP